MKQEIKQENNYFYTTDLCLAAIIKTSGHELKRFELQENGRGTQRMLFFFEKTQKVLDLFADFTMGKNSDCLKFKNFYNEIKDLKQLIYMSSGIN